jgi:hypothetical protein
MSVAVARTLIESLAPVPRFAAPPSAPRAPAPVAPPLIRLKPASTCSSWDPFDGRSNFPTAEPREAYWRQARSRVPHDGESHWDSSSAPAHWTAHRVRAAGSPSVVA